MADVSSFVKTIATIGPMPGRLSPAPAPFGQQESRAVRCPGVSVFRAGGEDLPCDIVKTGRRAARRVGGLDVGQGQPVQGRRIVGRRQFAVGRQPSAEDRDHRVKIRVDRLVQRDEGEIVRHRTGFLGQFASRGGRDHFAEAQLAAGQAELAGKGRPAAFDEEQAVPADEAAGDAEKRTGAGLWHGQGSSSVHLPDRRRPA
ncbi:hypothetical protein SI859A1_01105 [Aurantimonas manganoxydans SI85-9A1]|uniref:Uncharacterized protein n=1 Tax=Aurantimonas manganoxydans (strain ATCC BAA-1229 / DSM 21871 / SI85-9A1) TaxID=287752 RepID=Q1YEG9_AURMS|nr:hypothetical protein SI859A1_01105 [Aurantimonas manganoxydans SI85-9A1]